ncbi:MAG: Uma2 family endonuclease [Elainellaceae cyanobacterium]
MIQTARLSIKEYHQIVASGALGSRRIELLNGELIEVSPETPYHANRNNRLFKYLLAQFDSLADVRSAHPITLMDSEPQPDIALAQLPENRYDTRHPGPGDLYLVLEVSYSTLEYDLGRKREIYEAAGICDYWVLDLRDRRLHVFGDLVEGTYQQRRELVTGAVSMSAFPQVQLSVARLIGS